MGTSCTIVLSLEQKPRSMAQEPAETLLLLSAFQIAVKSGGTWGQCREGIWKPSLCSVHWAHSQSFYRGLVLIMECLYQDHHALPALSLPAGVAFITFVFCCTKKRPRADPHSTMY